MGFPCFSAIARSVMISTEESYVGRRKLVTVSVL